MNDHETRLLKAAESLYAWVLLPDNLRTLDDVRREVEPVLRLYESDVVTRRLKLESDRKALVT